LDGRADLLKVVRENPEGAFVGVALPLFSHVAASATKRVRTMQRPCGSPT